ncbi:MAG TPA: hypothetical protein VIL74_00395 [Pyrinomonadaceae bacterium]
MSSGKKIKRSFIKNESGVALITVIMISVLLMIACIAILSAVGSHSRNVTDVLTESKAYYAAESGLQATIDILRNNQAIKTAPPTSSVIYMKASTPADSNYTNDPYNALGIARLSKYLTYNYPATGTPDRVTIGTGTYNPNTGVAYSVEITDPDRTNEYLTFYTSGVFLSGGTISNGGKTITNNGVSITINDAPSTTVNFLSGYTNPVIGTFNMTSGGSLMSGAILEFRIDYKLTAPRTDTRSIYGNIKQVGSQITVSFPSQNLESVGSQIELCLTANATPPCPNVSFDLTANPTNRQLFAYMTRVEPRRLRVVSTGYGPNGSKKKLEAFIQRDLLDGIASGATTTMIGDSNGMRFEPGTSNNISYSGGQVDANGNCISPNGCVPSFGLTNPTNLQYVLTHPPGGGSANMSPPPALLDSSNTPGWQQSPGALDALVNQLRTVARNSPGSYFVNPTGDQPNFNVGSNQNPPGSYALGTGITFCEGSCKISANGGGILVVTGKLENVGNFHFRGMIIVTGEEGWERNGTGGGQVIGNVVIAPYNRIPYNPQNLTSTFLAPQYYVNGGGVSTITYADVGTTLDGTLGVSNFMLGIAEK